MAALLFILLLIGLIIVHELGHFAAAKLFDIRVDEFGVFFPPRIFALRRGETEYSLNWLPLGGFVRIFGENPDEAGADPRSLAARSRFVQAAVIVAGVVVNALVAWLLLSAAYMAGLPTSLEHDGIGSVTNARPTVVGVLPGSPADKAGLATWDVVEVLQTGSQTFDLRTLDTDQQAGLVRAFIAQHADESVILTVSRNGEDKTFLAKPADGLVAGRKAVGIELDDVGILRLAPPSALVQGAVLAKDLFVATAEGMGSFFSGLVRGHADLNEVSGPIGIVSMGGAAVKEGFSEAVVLVASVSMALAIFNLVPIPGLDGGRLLIIAIEGATRRRVPPRLVAWITLAGLALLVILMLVVSYHDIAKLVG